MYSRDFKSSVHLDGLIICGLIRTSGLKAAVRTWCAVVFVLPNLHKRPAFRMFFVCWDLKGLGVVGNRV